MNQQHWIDRRLENWSRKLAWHTSRRGFIAKLGTLLAGAAALPLLPISRTMAQQLDSGFDDSTVSGEQGDPSNCNYWRYCGVDGFLSSNCGGTHTSCPPGTEMSPITWIGTCRNPADGRKYLVSYNDCCGSDSCGTNWCERNDNDRPIYVTPKSNDVLWCLGTSSKAYNSTVALVLGVSGENS
tara:strand:+ start:135 stop:683 length:549 start_codon:yes stop_codon:yes gene_type:complete